MFKAVPASLTLSRTALHQRGSPPCAPASLKGTWHWRSSIPGCPPLPPPPTESREGFFPRRPAAPVRAAALPSPGAARPPDKPARRNRSCRFCRTAGYLVYASLRSALNVCQRHTAPPNGHASMSAWLAASGNKNIFPRLTQYSLCVIVQIEQLKHKCQEVNCFGNSKRLLRTFRRQPGRGYRYH